MLLSNINKERLHPKDAKIYKSIAYSFMQLRLF